MAGTVSSAAEDSPIILHTPGDYGTHFDASEYFHYYFSDASMKDEVRTSLFAMSIFASVIRQATNRRLRVLDIGCGPTIHTAVCFRDIAEEIHLADYSSGCLELLRRWLSGTSEFSWDAMIRKIICCEGGSVVICVDEVENNARELVRRGGIHFADIHRQNVLESAQEDGFDVVVTIFCLESACSDHREYKRALTNMLKLLQPSGYFVLGTLIGHTTYTAGMNQLTGEAKLFTILNISERFLLECLKEVSMDMATLKKLYREDDGVLFLLVKKKAEEERS